jgi:peptidoglycan hydrolase CwlO-like protein
MSDDRLERIAATVNSLVAGQAELQAGQAELRTGQAELRASVDSLHKRQDGFERRLSRVEILQEEMRDDIKGIAEGHAATQAAVQRGFDTLKAHLDRRIDPLEYAVRKLMGT